MRIFITGATGFVGTATVKELTSAGHQTSVPSLACRLYENRSGIPSEELLRSAISDAMRKE